MIGKQRAGLCLTYGIDMKIHQTALLLTEIVMDLAGKKLTIKAHERGGWLALESV